MGSIFWYVGAGVLAWAILRPQMMMPVVGTITSKYGFRLHPILKYPKLHEGIDFGAPPGTPVRAADEGTVILAGVAGGYGNAVYLDHGNLTTRYGHLLQILVQRGQKVIKGQVIGLVGSTGLSTGPHLHFEVRSKPGDVPLDPAWFV
jgi:murein DD-endopeptidase MepM/ murein hydrolase activator NlpD